MENFNNWEIDYEANYGGSDKKIGLKKNNERYMLKIADVIPDAKRNNLNSSYSNSPLSEYVSCKILKELGFPVQDVVYGEITTSSKKYGERIKPAVACKNFVPKDMAMVDFKFICGAITDNKPGKIPKISEIYEVFSENIYFKTSESAQRALDSYWDLFVIDALLANFDRHGNNFAYFISKDGRSIQSTPIYDCGSCLFPQITDEAIEKMKDYQYEIQQRVDKFPTAALKLENGNKANYKEYMLSLENEDLNKAIKRIVPKIHIEKIKEVVESIEELSEVRRKFIIDILVNRYEKILLPAYTKILETENTKNQIIGEEFDQEIDI